MRITIEYTVTRKYKWQRSLIKAFCKEWVRRGHGFFNFNWLCFETYD